MNRGELIWSRWRLGRYWLIGSVPLCGVTTVLAFLIGIAFWIITIKADVLTYSRTDTPVVVTYSEIAFREYNYVQQQCPFIRSGSNILSNIQKNDIKLSIRKINNKFLLISFFYYSTSTTPSLSCWAFSCRSGSRSVVCLWQLFARICCL